MIAANASWVVALHDSDDAHHHAAAALRVAFDIVDVDPDAPLRWATKGAGTGLRLPDVIAVDTALHHRSRAVATFDGKLAVRSMGRNLEILGGHSS